MNKWHMIIDVARCHDCNNCFLADKDEFVGNDFPPFSKAQPWSGHRWMNIERKERGQYPLAQVSYLPIPCQHCEDAPCLTDDGTVYKREDGLVIIDPEKARGRKEIVDSCPYGAIYWNEEAQLAQKCTGCAHLMDQGWTETRCSQVCPTGAIKLVLATDEEMRRQIADQGLMAFKAERGTNPRVLYKNLHRWDKVFVSGNVAFGDTDECAEGAKVVVTADGDSVGEEVASCYGDFVVDHLEPGRDHVVRISAAGYETVEQAVTPESSVNLGQITLQRA